MNVAVKILKKFLKTVELLNVIFIKWVVLMVGYVAGKILKNKRLKD